MITLTLIGIIAFLCYNNIKICSSLNKYKSRIRELEFERTTLKESIHKLVENQNIISSFFKPSIN